MERKSFFILMALVLIQANLFSQGALKYQLPPAEIVKIVDTPQPPSVSVSPDQTNILLIERPELITIEELAAEELRIAGLRINPAISGPSRQT